MNKRTFGAADYAVFGVVLGVSALIGIFYAIRDRRSKSGTEGYLLASRSMGVFPVAVSLTVSFMSAITVLGTPAEVYSYGTMYWWYVVVFAIVAIIVSQIYLPTFYNLGISSTYEYLEKRFSRPVRLLGTLTYLVQSILYIGIVIYAPALALNEVTGLDLWMSIITTALICTFYTVVGGLKAVLWTDVFQGFVMCAGFIAVIIRGSVLHGGFANIWNICEQGGRIDFVHFDTDMRVRHSFWSVMLGGIVTWLSVYAVNQSQVQRYLCCKSARKATYALFLNVLGLFIVISLSCMTGLVIYARYATCDPLSQKCIGANDQLFPYLVMDILRDYPGVPGLFVSCVFSGSLSTISSGINAMATVTMEDFIKPFTSWRDRTYNWISKGLIVLYGLGGLGMAALASTLGGILEATYAIVGLIGGPLVGLFTLGLLIPFANSIGASFGLLSGIGVTTWIYLERKAFGVEAEFLRKKYLNTTGCTTSCYFENNFNATTTSATANLATVFSDGAFSTSINYTSTPMPLEDRPAIPYFYSMSYLYGTVFGMASTILIGMIFSMLTCGWRDRQKVDPSLLSPFFDNYIFRWLPKKFRHIMRCCVGEKKKKKFNLAGASNPSYEQEVKLSHISTSMGSGSNGL